MLSSKCMTSKLIRITWIDLYLCFYVWCIFWIQTMNNKRSRVHFPLLNTCRNFSQISHYNTVCVHLTIMVTWWNCNYILSDPNLHNCPIPSCWDYLCVLLYQGRLNSHLQICIKKTKHMGITLLPLSAFIPSWYIFSLKVIAKLISAYATIYTAITIRNKV